MVHSIFQLTKVPGKSKKRVGRGSGSGKGKTCGRGHKGQKARSGVSLKGFEGGQQPMYTRLPIRGFVSISRLSEKRLTISLTRIMYFVRSGRVTEGTVLDAKGMQKVGIISRISKYKRMKIKVVAGHKDEVYNFPSSLVLEVQAISSSARKILEECGTEIRIAQ